MTFDEVLDFAAAEMDKALDGKKYKLENAAKNGAAKAYREGAIHAWEIARRVARMRKDEIRAAFEVATHEIVFSIYNHIEAEERLQEHDEVREEIERQALRVGDEVFHHSHGTYGVVTMIENDPPHVCVLFSTGETAGIWGNYQDAITKTGRKYGDLNDILFAMTSKTNVEADE